MKFAIRRIIGARETAGRVSVFEEVTRPGEGPPLHLHESQVEVFHVLKGIHRFRVGDEEVLAGPGECLGVPAATPHAFRNESDDDGLLRFELIPSGSADEFFERLVAGDFDPADIGSFFAAHGIRLLGPPLGAPGEA